MNGLPEKSMNFEVDSLIEKIDVLIMPEKSGDAGVHLRVN